MKTAVTLMLAMLSVTFAGAATAGEGRAKFVRVVEQTIDGKEYVGVVVRPADRDEPVTLLLPPANTEVGQELRARVRRLREGQLVELAHGEEEGRRWVRDIRPAREGEGDRGDRREAVREPAARGENVERQLAEMREEILRLRREVEELRRARGDRVEPREEAARPERGEREARPEVRRGDTERSKPEAQRDRPREEGARREGGDREARREGPRDEGVRREAAEARRDEPREPAGRREGELRGTFVKRTEVKVGDYDFLAIVVRPADRDEPVTLTIPRRNEDLNYAARQLREGQEVGIVWVEEEGQRWLRRLQK